jgi:signal transduction histidine kinase
LTFIYNDELWGTATIVEIAPNPLAQPSWRQTGNESLRGKMVMRKWFSKLNSWGASLTGPIVQSATEDRARRQYLTQTVLTLMVSALLPFTLLVAAGWPAGIFSLGDVEIMLALAIPTGICWLLARRGHWQWGSYLAPILMFGLGLFGSALGNIGAIFVIFYGLAILLTGMLVGNWAQWVMVGLCTVTHVGVAGTYHSWPLDAQLANAITLSGGFVGIALLQWFSTRQLQRALAQARATAVELRAEMAERQRVEAEREQLIAELEAKNAELERFTYTVSHDLKAPLITIGGFLGFLEKDVRAGNFERIKADIVRISEAATKMQRLLNELLELSRIGRMMNLSQAVPFETIAREAVELVRGFIKTRGVQVEIASDLPVVYGDRLRLVEAVQNLIDNACKFMGDQPEPRLEIGQRGADTNGQPVFFVRDNGLGIDPPYHDQIFGLFNKLDPQSEGTGVGLTLVKRIIEVHGGRIWVESAGAGQGAAFYFTLPGQAS